MLIGAMAILLLVCALLAVAFLRPRADRAPSVRRWIVGGGIAFSSVVLVGLLAYGLVVGEHLLPREDARLVKVVAQAQRWHWTFTQPGNGRPIRTYNVLNIPAGRPIDVELTTLDVIHSFWVPRLAGKMDAIPGHPNILRIEADAPGIYYGLCAEFCGAGHSRHGFRVVAHDEASWSRFQTGER